MLFVRGKERQTDREKSEREREREREREEWRRVDCSGQTLAGLSQREREKSEEMNKHFE